MKLITDPTERTTAATDLILSLLALALMAGLSGRGPAERVQLWSWMLGLLALASLLGALAHGLQMSGRANRLLWLPINLCLGMVVSLFAAGVVLDLWGMAVMQGALPWLLGAAAAFFALTVLVPGTFLVFIVFEALALVFALAGYGTLALSGQLAGAGWLFAGVLLTLAAAGIQASGRVRLQAIWTFDHNGVFHLVQMPGLILIWIGLVQGG